MTPGERRQRLAALGLVDWRERAATPKQAETTVAAAQAGTKAVSAASQTTVMTAPDESAPAAAPSSMMMPTGESGQSSQSPTALATLDWAGLAAWLNGQDHRGARNAVFGTGAQTADLLIVGEAPGAREDEQGLPFVGPAGQLLDRMLAAIGRCRQRDVYITNICKFRPPSNRDPHADEIAADRPVLERQIELLQPKLMVAVGRVAAQTLLGRTEPLGKLRGQVHQYPQRELPVIVTYHPAYLLRSPAEKAKSWVDLRRIAALLQDAG